MTSGERGLLGGSSGGALSGISNFCVAKLFRMLLLLLGNCIVFIGVGGAACGGHTPLPLDDEGMQGNFFSVTMYTTLQIAGYTSRCHAS